MPFLRRNPPRPPEIRINGAFLATILGFLSISSGDKYSCGIEHPEMSQPSSKTTPPSYPEFAVRRETISRYFHPPLPRSTFHDFVSKGKILPVKGIRGFYRLNESLKRLGLREAPCLPVDASKRSIEEILRLALTMIDPAVFPMPPWAVVQEEWDLQEIDHAKHLAEMHREAIESLESFQEKVAYGAGALDAQAELDAESKSDAE